MRLRHNKVLIVGIETGSYGIMRLSTSPQETLQPIITQRNETQQKFMQSYTNNGIYFGSSDGEKSLSTGRSKKEDLSRLAQRSLRTYTPQDFQRFELTDIERQRRKFMSGQPEQVAGSSMWDEYLKLVFNCGISTGKSSLLPVALTDGDRFCISGTREIIQNEGVDNIRFYDPEKEGEVRYQRATRNARVNLGESISTQIRQINTAIIRKIKEISNANVPYINVDYRLIGDSPESIQNRQYTLSIAEIHADFVDFINDGLLFEKNGTTEQSTVQRNIESLLESINPSVIAILCPPRWQDNQLYQTEISFLQDILNSQGKTIQCIEEEVEGAFINYQPKMNTQGKSIPATEILSLLNDRWAVKKIIEEVISEMQRDYPQVATPRSIVISEETLPTRFKKRGATSFSVTEPRKYYEAVKYWQEQIASSGLVETNFYVIKPRNHSIKKTRPVTFRDISGFNTLFDYLKRYGDILVEAIDTTPWSECAFQAGAVSEIKTISWVKK